MYISFSITSTSLPSYSAVLPSVNITASNSTHVYSSLGGLVFAEFSSVYMNKIISTENNPKNILQSETNFVAFIAELPTIGMYISTSYSILTANLLKISGHSVDQSKYQDTSNVVFLKAASTTLTISNSVFNNHIFSDAGFLVASSSVVNILATNFISFQ